MSSDVLQFHTTCETGYGMPSGHIMSSSLIVYLLLLQFSPRLICWRIAHTLIAVMGVSRVFTGSHFPSQVLVGWLFGYLTARLSTDYLSSRLSTKSIDHSAKRFVAVGLTFSLCNLAAAAGVYQALDYSGQDPMASVAKAIRGCQDSSSVQYTGSTVGDICRMQGVVLATTFAFSILPLLLPSFFCKTLLSSPALCAHPTSQCDSFARFYAPVGKRSTCSSPSHSPPRSPTRVDGHVHFPASLSCAVHGTPLFPPIPTAVSNDAQPLNFVLANADNPQNCWSRAQSGSLQGGALRSAKWWEVAPWSELLVRGTVAVLAWGDRGQREHGRSKKEIGEDNKEEQDRGRGGEEAEEFQRFTSSAGPSQSTPLECVAEPKYRREQESLSEKYRKCLSVGGKFLVYVQLTRLVLYATVSIFVWFGVVGSVTGRDVVGGSAAKGCFQFWYGTVHVVGAVVVDVLLGSN
eukprot:GHVS01051215.1.p1 GENE.GHVS01051215.1~~GHVS01051215.1.p1  ORF type:complete len:462 (-),score=60.14 GHVS01051215.1:15-1400(-)